MYLIDALKVFDRTQAKKKGAFRSPLAWGVLSLTEQLPSQPSLLKRFSSLGACSPIGNFIPLYHGRALALSIKGRSLSRRYGFERLDALFEPASTFDIT